ncbi:outer membrane beta-barrel family protein [Niabella sp. W65]|nr:outer membrane beta-barrel family protein [Niabella sp. W65]MCH7362545.1 outer membrane beta-barrel family protein [Niabella sp. W65]
MDNRTKYSDGLTLTAKAGKLGITVNGSLDGIASPLKSFNSSTTLPLVSSAYQKRKVSATEATTRMMGSGTLELNYEIDSLHSVISSLVISGYKNQKDISQDIETELASGQQHSWLYNVTNDRAPSTTIGVDYTKKSGSNAGRYTTFRFNWAGSRNFSDNDGVQQYNNGGTSNKWIVNEAVSRNDEFTFQLDAVPVARKTYTIEGGLKAILRKARSDNNSRFTFNLSQPYQEDQDNSNRLHYSQQVYSGYSSIMVKLKTHSVRAGIRIEQTSIKGDFEGVVKPIEEGYLSLIPNFSWTNKISKTTTAILSYNLALQRPFITTLNPFINKIDSFNISYGNPGVGPQKFIGYPYKPGTIAARYSAQHI